jgi:hypothetical protein
MPACTKGNSSDCAVSLKIVNSLYCNDLMNAFIDNVSYATRAKWPPRVLWDTLTAVDDWLTCGGTNIHLPATCVDSSVPSYWSP